MRSELVLERSTGELRAARIEDGEVVELGLARDPPTDAEAIHHARVTARTESGGAFLDLGAGLSGFLARAGKRLGEGRYLPVQLGPEPVEPGKTRIVSSRPRIVGRYLTLLLGAQGVESAGQDAALERHCADVAAALPELVAAFRVRLRPAAACVPLDAVLGEAQALAERAAGIDKAGDGPGELLAAPAPLHRMLREAPAEPAAVHLSEAAMLAEARRHAAHWPDILEALTLWRAREPLFEAFGAEDAWHTVLEGILALPSGGRITLEETQAAGVIDVDAGGTKSGGSPTRMRLTANLEAAAAVAGLLRLADIGGLVVVDFIDLSARKDREALLKALDTALARDPLSVQRSGMNGHGVVTLTRPRRQVSLRETLLERPTPRPSLETRALACLRRAEREAAHAKPGALRVAAEPDVADWIARHGYLDRLQDRIGRSVTLTPES